MIKYRLPTWLRPMRARKQNYSSCCVGTYSFTIRCLKKMAAVGGPLTIYYSRFSQLPLYCSLCHTLIPSHTLSLTFTASGGTLLTIDLLYILTYHTCNISYIVKYSIRDIQCRSQYIFDFKKNIIIVDMISNIYNEINYS